MKKRCLAMIIMIVIVLSGCQGQNQGKTEEVFQVDRMNQDLLEGAKSLPKSKNLYFENGLEITGLGLTYDGRPTDFDGCYYFPAIEAMTGAHVSIDWQEDEGYSSAIAATLLANKTDLPDILNPTGFGVMDLADDELIVPLDDYLDLMPDIVAAVGEEHMDAWKASDGHIYTIPSVSTIQGSFSMLVRQDWLKALNLETPKT